jgi:hypothetical protein
MLQLSGIEGVGCGLFWLAVGRWLQAAAGASVAGAGPVAAAPKGHLVEAAERIDRATALLKGYLKKKNSAGHWQKRWFEIVGHYFV